MQTHRSGSLYVLPDGECQSSWPHETMADLQILRLSRGSTVRFSCTATPVPVLAALVGRKEISDFSLTP